MTTLIPAREIAGGFRLLLDIEDQPGDCGYGCPCNVGPSDGSDYGARWVPVRDEPGKEAARLLYAQARNVLADLFPDSDADIVLAHRALALDVGERFARQLLADPRYSLPPTNSETTRP